MIYKTPGFRSWLLACLPLFLIVTSSVFAQEFATESKPLLIGRAFQEALNARKSLSYAGTPLRKTLQDLQANTGICILLDRRINPTTTVNVTTPYVTSRQIIEVVARHVGMAASFGESYVIIGPKHSTEKLKTLSEINRKAVLQLRRKLEGDVYRKLSESRDRSWPKLSQPAMLIFKETKAIGVGFDDADSIPHDVWAEAILPPLSFSDFATLILIQFDLTFELTADGSLRLIPMPDAVGIQRQYRVLSNNKATVAKRIAEEFPELSITWKGNSASVFATVEVHESLEQIIKGKPNSSATAAGLKTRLFTFKVPDGTPLGAIVEKFRQSDVPIRIEGATEEVASKAMSQTVGFEFTDTEGDDFFPKVFADIAAKVIVDDNEVVLQF